MLFFSSFTGAAAPEIPSPHVVLAFTAAPAELTQHEGTDVTFSLTRDGKPLTNTKLHVADNPAFAHMLTGLQRTNHRGILVMPNLTARSEGPQTIEITALGQSLYAHFRVLPARAASATATGTASSASMARADSPPWGSSSGLPHAAAPSSASPSSPPAPASSAASPSLPSGSSPPGFPSGAAPSAAPHKPVSQSLFNATVSFFGMPGLTPGVSPVDGLKDEGRGFHADGSTRKAGSGAAQGGSDFSGQRAASYAGAGLGDAKNLPMQDWLYGPMLGITRDREGRAFDMGSEYSALRAKSAASGSSFGGIGSSGGQGGRTIFESVLQRGLSAGMGFANTTVESALLGVMSGYAGKDNPYGSGKVRLNFHLDADGRQAPRLQGEGDVLWPLYDSLHTTIYTQFGARSMLGGGKEYGPDRWIGNIGVGQRWFPAAFMDADDKPNSGNWMLGYNAFYDVDLTRGHKRGGFGLEAQYDWLKVGTNWYLPLSDWKNSQDFDGRYVQERAAQGWDFRVKGYLPFYRQLAVTGSFTQWYGDYVGTFGPAKLEKDPRVWSYGLEYTPVPAVTLYATQRTSEQGRADTEFGLRFTYEFGMDAESQFKPARVEETRNVHGSRHEFVDRENKIILEYRTKNAYYIDFVGYSGNVFTFRVRDGFNKLAVGKLVQVAAGGAVTIALAPEAQSGTFLAEEKSLLARVWDSMCALFAAFSPPLGASTAHADSAKAYTSDNNGLIYVRVDDVNRLDLLRVSVDNVVKVFDRPALTLGPAKAMTLTADKDSIFSNGTAALTLDNAPLNSTITWKVEGAGGAGAGISGGDKTDAGGKATATFTPGATSKGTTTVTATVNGESASLNLTVKEDGYALAVNPTTMIVNTPTKVRFTVTRNGAPLSPGNTVNVSVDPPGSITLPATITGNGGILEVPGLTATAAGTCIVTITASDGKTASCTLTVNTARYSLSSSHATLIENKSERVTFTVKKDGALVPDTSSVRFLPDDTHFTGLPTTAQAPSGGQVVVDALTGKKAGTPTLNITVDGQPASLPLSITSAATSVEASHATLVQHQPTPVAFTVKQGGNAVADNTEVTFSADGADFYNLAGVMKKTVAGRVVQDLTALKTGTRQIVRVHISGVGGVGGQSFDLPMQVSAVGYAVQSSHSALTQHKAENVILTVLQGGKAAPENIPVSLLPHAAFPDLNTAEQKTISGGQIVVTGLTASKTGAHTLQATVARQPSPLNVPLTVSPAAYSLSASSATPLVEGTPADVTFTVERNGAALPEDSEITFSHNPNLSPLPSGPQKVLSGGKITVKDLKATASGAQTVEITVSADGAKAQTALAVGSATYSLTATHAPLTQHTPASVTFTVMQGGVAVAADTLVLFTHNPALPALPGSATPTTAGGKIVVTGLTPLASGPQTVEITVGGKKTSASLAVNPAVYALAISPTPLLQHVPTDMTFTFSRGGTALPEDTAVTFAGNGNFLNLPGSVALGTGGSVTVDKLITTAASDQTVTASVDGQSVSASIPVTAAAYTLVPSPATLTQNVATDVRFTVQRGGATVGAGIPVSFAKSTNFKNLPVGELKTNASGEISVSGLMTTAPTGQSLTATVAGQKLDVDFTVTAATYTVTANPATLTQYSATDVAFTVLQDNVPVSAGIPVTFAQNANFTNLPSETQITNASGQVLVRGLVTKAPSEQNISFTAGGQSLAQDFSVSPARLTITPDKSILTQGMPQQVIFTLACNNTPVPAGVSLSFTPNTNITGIPNTAVSTEEGGIITTNLTALTRDKLTVEARVGEQLLSTALGVNGTDFTVSVNPQSLTQYKATDVSLSVTGWGGAPHDIGIESNNAFDNLPSSVNVGAAGKGGTLPDLIARTTGAQVLEFIHPVDGSRAYAALKVLAPEYKITATPKTLTRDKAESVTFTLTRGDSALPDGVPVTFSGANFQGLLPAQQLVTGGSTTFILTPTAEGKHSVTATAEGVSFAAEIEVGVADYALSIAADPTSIKIFESSILTATVTKNGLTAPDGTVVHWSVVSGPGVFTSGEGTTATARTSTTSAGKASITVQGTAAGAVKVQANMGTGTASADSSITVQSSTLALSTDHSTLIQHKPQDVVLTLKRNGAPLANTSVTLSGAGFSGTGFDNLPQIRSTNALGQISLPGLTATDTATPLTLTATVNPSGGSGSEERASTDFTVTAAALALTPSTTELVHHMPQDVVFTLTRNGSPLGSTSVGLESSDFTGLPTTQQTNASGQFTLSGLTALTLAPQVITARVEGMSFTPTFTVKSAVYLMNAAPLTLTQHMGQDVVFTLTRNGAPFSGAEVTLTSTSADFSGLSVKQDTNASGQVTLPNLTATTLAPPHTITATVPKAGASSPFTFNFTVSAARYTLTADTTTLTVNKETPTRFTLMRNDEPLPANTDMTFSVSPAGDITNLPMGKTGSGGTMEALKLTGKTVGTPTLTATSNDGQKADMLMTVVASKYSVTSSHSALVQNQAENVTFTVKQDGALAPDTTKVFFTLDNTNFKNLPTAEVNIPDSQVVVNNLTGLQAGSPALKLKVNGQEVSVPMTITPAVYSVEASRATLIQHTGEDVILTVKQNGKAVGKDVTVTIIEDKTNFYNLPTSLTTNSSGQVTLPKLAALTEGSLSIRGTAGKADGLGGPGSTDGTEFTLPMQVSAVGYAVQSSHSVLTQHKAENVTLTVLRGGKAAPANIPVSFATDTNFSGLLPTAPKTNDKGQIEFSALAALTTGTHNLQLTVAGQGPLSLPLTVSPATYSLNANPTTLTENDTAKPVTFTIMRNGEYLPAGEKVTFSPNTNLPALPVDEQTVGSNGALAAISLIATASGAQTVEITVSADGAKAQTSLAVGSTTYSLTATHAPLTQHTPASVTFTVMQGGVAVPADTLVIFTPSPAWAKLPGSATPTITGGQIVVTGLTPLASGPQTVEITVGGKKTSVSLAVNPAVYALAISPTPLLQHVPTNMTFTFSRGGTALPEDTAVTFASNGNFLNLPGSVALGTGGSVTVDKLITTAASDQTVTASVDGQSVSASIPVTAAAYTLVPSPATLTQNVATDVRFTVQRGGATVGTGIPVSFAKNAHFQYVPVGELKTNASGEISVSGLMTTAPTEQSLTTTVAGQKFDVDFTVTAATYTLATNPATLTQHRDEDVVFIVLQDGKPVREGLPVTFAENANFKTLPTGVHTTNASGQILVSNLVTTASSGQNISLTVDGQNVACGIQVTPALYALTPDQSILTQGAEQPVIFTLTRNNGPAPKGVSLSFTPNANVEGLPDTVSTEEGGKITTTLKALNRDKLNLEASVDDQRLSTALGVTSADFTVSLTPTALTQYKATDVNLTVTGWGGASKTLDIVPSDTFPLLPASVTVDAEGKGTLSGLVAQSTGAQVLEFVRADGVRAYAVLKVSAPEYKLSASPTSPATSLTRDKQENVTFTLTRGDSALPDTVPVTFSGAAFQGLPTGPVYVTGGATDGSIAFDLTPTAEGKHSVTATAEGVSFATELTVGAAEYTVTLAATPNPINIFESSILTATVTKNGETAPDGTVVTWAASGPGVFTSGEGLSEEAPLARTSTTSGGKASVTVQGTGTGEIKVQASAGTGAGMDTAQSSVTVAKADYALTASQNTLTQYMPQDVTLTLTRNGAALANTSVTLSGEGLQGADFGGKPQPLPLILSTNALGQIPVPGLTATTLGTGGTLTLTASFNPAGGASGGSSETCSLDFTVTAATYDLKASTTSLVQHLPQDVVLTLTRNNAPLGNTLVTITDKGGLSGLDNSYTTNANGEIRVNQLLSTSTGTGSTNTLTATFNPAGGASDGSSETRSVTFTATPATYKLSATPTALTVGQATPVTFTLTRNDAPLTGTDVTLTGSSGLTITSPGTKTDASGKVSATLTGTATGSPTVTATTLDGQTANASFTVSNTYSLKFGTVTGAGTGSTFVQSQAATIPVTVLQNGVAYSTATKVTWSVLSANNTTNPAVTTAFATRTTGLAWGDIPKEETSSPTNTIGGSNTSTTTTSGIATIQLTDIVGERTVTVQASVTLEGKSYTATQVVTYGTGPLGALRLPAGGDVGKAQWGNNYVISDATSFPAARMCGGSASSSWISGNYSTTTKLPTRGMLQVVSTTNGKGANFAAGWPVNIYWSGEVRDTTYIHCVFSDGRLDHDGLANERAVVCRR